MPRHKFPPFSFIKENKIKSRNRGNKDWKLKDSFKYLFKPFFSFQPLSHSYPSTVPAVPRSLIPNSPMNSRGEINDLLIGASFISACVRFSAESFTCLPLAFYVYCILQRLLFFIKCETSVSSFFFFKV